ncbi:hypothetical protein MMC10_000760 [Thelotrema lepadinum]|nr:hypothetical protein [Thelotrema lepadinum]
MSAKLDQSLDDIVSSRRTTTRGRGRGRRVGTRTAPAGGIQKNTRAAASKAAAFKVAATTSVSGADQKIIVSNLPLDVNESQIKEYFNKTIGPTRRVSLQYGPNGSSRGIATIIFNKPGMANEAFKQLNGLLVDKRPMKVELVVDASRAGVEPAKSLSDRVAKPAKSQPKQAGGTRTTDTTARGSGRAVRGSTRGRVRRGRNAGRPKPKTADELDAEMTDYFTGGPIINGDAAAVTNGTNPTAGGNEDTGMDGIA